MKTRVVQGLAILWLIAATAAQPEPPKSTSRAQPADPVIVNDPSFMTTFTEQYREAFKDGAIPAKYKQLSAAILRESAEQRRSVVGVQWIVVQA